jgi:hypothetical protein
METLSSLQAALCGGAKRRREDQAVTGEDPLQHSMKRLRDNETPFPASNFIHHDYGDQLAYHACQLRPNQQSSLEQELQQHSQVQCHGLNLEHHRNKELQIQEAGQNSSSKEQPQTYMPMNLLLGNLHQERRRLQQQRDHQTQRKTKSLPSNSKLY